MTGGSWAAGDEFADWDGAYVLGALAPSEHSVYEAHLVECERCRASVAALAGMPGLLARVPVEQLSGAEFDPVPSAVLPRLLVEAARERRRDRWRLATAGLVAAACLIALLVAVATSGRRGSDSAALGSAVSGSGSPTSTAGTSIGPPSSNTPPAPVLTLTPVGQRAVVATAQIQSVAWGTRIKIRCVRRPGEGPPPASPSGTTTPRASREGWYSLIIVDRNDRRTQVSSWSGQPATVDAEGDTPLRRDQIVGLLILDEHKDVVLKLAV